MLIEIIGNQYQVQEFANALGVPVEYYEDDKCGRFYEEVVSASHRRWFLTKLSELSFRFSLVVHDGGSEMDGPSPFCRRGAPLTTFYRVVMEDGCYSILDEEWEDDEVGEGQRATFHRIKDGVEYDLPLIEESPDPNDYETMLVYGCGDDLSHTPVYTDFAIMPAIEAPEHRCVIRCIIPEEIPEVDWATEGF